ncbi:PAS domain S-box protein, partial [candidate division KSB1 bacterium]|nr:PAS domain S-box protein [candidate division KSB1 bacterium]
GNVFRAEIINKKKNGELYYEEKTITPLKDSKGNITHFLSTGKDITEKKIAEEELRLSEERFRTIFEKGPVGIALAGMDGNFISVNDMYCNLLGYSKDELLKLKFIDITHEDDRAENEVFNKKMQKGEIESFSIEKRYLKKNGDILWVNVTTSQIRDKNGKPLYSMGIIEDITERRQLEKKREEAVKLAEKAARLTSLGTLAAGISHEINQPLTAIKIKVDGMLYWKNLSKEISADEVKECLEFVSEQSTRIDDIIKQMRVLAKQDKNSEPIEVVVNTVIRNALALVKQQMSARGVKLELNLARKVPRLKGHPGSLQQIIINLVVNAMHALENSKRKNKKITISTERIENSCKIEISDNGPGIPEKHIKHVFDPFFSTKKGSEGMGLGLSITDNIVSAYGGTISVRNKEKGGAQFTIMFPALN